MALVAAQGCGGFCGDAQGVFGLEEWHGVLHWDHLGIDRGNYTPSSRDTP